MIYWNPSEFRICKATAHGIDGNGSFNQRNSVRFALDTEPPLEKTSTLGFKADNYSPVFVECKEQTHLTFRPDAPFTVLGKNITRRFFYTGKDTASELLIFTDLTLILDDPSVRSEQFLQCVDFISAEELAKFGLARLKEFVK